MSRGLGAFQKRILAAVQGGIEQGNLLCWHLAVAGGHLTAQGDIVGSYYSQFRKALKALEPEHLISDWRYLNNFEELERYYPALSRSDAVRDLRQKLLPIIRSYVRSKSPRYSLKENEQHLLERQSHEFLAAAKQRWAELRVLLFQCARTHPSDATAEAALEVRLKGDEFFVNDSIYSSGESLGNVLTRAKVHLPPDLHQALVAFYRDIWPVMERRQAALKSQLIWVADFRTSKEPVLQSGFLEFLAGHTDPSIRDLVVRPYTSGLGRLSQLGPPKPTSKLKRALLRDAVGRFQFLHLASPSPSWGATGRERR